MDKPPYKARNIFLSIWLFTIINLFFFIPFLDTQARNSANYRLLNWLGPTILADITIGTLAFVILILLQYDVHKFEQKQRQIKVDIPRYHEIKLKSNPWLIASILLMILVAYLFGKNGSNLFLNTSLNISPTPVPLQINLPGLNNINLTPTPQSLGIQTKTFIAPQVECIGPDGVHFKTTQKACDDLNNFWKNPNQPQTQPTDDGWERTVEGKSTLAFIPRDDHMSTSDELFIAVNNYRISHNIGTLIKHGTLCGIAEARANEQLALGDLDDHNGFGKYVDAQRDFRYVQELLFGGKKPISGVHIVEYGWDRSLTGHQDGLQDRTMTYGCAGIAGYFAVLIMGGN